MNVLRIGSAARGLKVLSAGLLALWVVLMTAGCGPEEQHVTPDTTPAGQAPGGGSVDEYKAKMNQNVQQQGTGAR
jgi:hypothetical protein